MSISRILILRTLNSICSYQVVTGDFMLGSWCMGLTYLKNIISSMYNTFQVENNIHIV